MIIWKNFSLIFILNSYPLCNKKGGRLIVEGIFINGFFYVVRAKTYLSALFFIFWSGEEKKMSDRASVSPFLSLFFIFSLCLLHADAESYELSNQYVGG